MKLTLTFIVTFTMLCVMAVIANNNIETRLHEKRMNKNERAAEHREFVNTLRDTRRKLLRESWD